jgi:alkylation response protein AidB-like acyl-CoA dehydrogenase
VIVDLDLTPDQELLRDTTRKFLQTTVPLTAVRALAENPDGFDRGWWQRGAELGWTSLLVDERRGGGSVSEAGLRDLALVAEEMGAMVSPGPLLATTGLRGPRVARPAGSAFRPVGRRVVRRRAGPRHHCGRDDDAGASRRRRFHP